MLIAVEKSSFEHHPSEQAVNVANVDDLSRLVAACSEF